MEKAPFLERLKTVLKEVLPLVRDLPVVFGRALSGQKRGPRIFELPLTNEQLDYFRKGSWYGREAVALLEELGVGRIELDNLLQGIAPLPSGVTGSLHYRYAMVTSSRNCPFLSGSGARGCGEVFILSAEQSPHPLYQGGNTQFFKNESLPEGLAASGVDRLVFHPHLPC